MSDPRLDLHTISSEDSAYPAALKRCSVFKAAPTLTAIGNLSLLFQPLVALFGSTQCPTELLLKTHDFARSLDQKTMSIISGFHTPVEQDCWNILLQRHQPMICCPARSIHNLRLSSEQNQAIADGRLLLLSPFSASYRRATAALAAKRNELIGAIAPTILIVHAAPGSKTLAFAQRLATTGKTVVTFDSPANAGLHQLGIPGLEVVKFLAM